jgi:hypothetical protein
MPNMIDYVTVDRDKIYRGAGRVVMSNPTILTSFPGQLESVMNPSVPATGTPYALASGWLDLGPTDEDGFTLSREAELSDGIPLDQRRTALDEGEPEGWNMQLDTSLLHTDLENIQIAWEGGTIRDIASGPSNVAQRSLDLDAPGSFTERMLAVIQEDPKTGKLRAFVFRKVTPRPEGEINIQSAEATGLPASFTLKADEDISEGNGQFGKIFEETSS